MFERGDEGVAGSEICRYKGRKGSKTRRKCEQNRGKRRYQLAERAKGGKTKSAGWPRGSKKAVKGKRK